MIFTTKCLAQGGRWGAKKKWCLITPGGTNENYQIKTTNYFDQNYIQSLFKGQNIDLSEMAYKSKFGFNNNEVSLIPKNIKKTGFFEKFFQLFS